MSYGLLKFWMFLLATGIIGITLAQEEVSRDWAAINTYIDISTDQKIKFTITAWVKLEGANERSSASIFYDIENKKEESGSGNSSEEPITPSEWTKYKLKGTFSENAERSIFGAKGLDNGKFYFDDFQLKTKRTYKIK